MTLPTTIREELANLRALAAGIVDGCASIEAMLPVEPPPVDHEPILPVIELHGDILTLSPDAPSQVLTVNTSQPAPSTIQAALSVTGFAPEGARISAVLDFPGPVIAEGGLFAETRVTVTQFPEPGESATFDVSLTGVQGGIIGVNHMVTFRVDGPPVPPPPPEPIHVSLWADSSKLAMPEKDGAVELFANLSRPAETDMVIPLVCSGDATQGIDYSAPVSILIHAGQQSGTSKVFSINDDIDESNETIVIAIESSDAYVIDQPSVLITITDDDEPPPPPPPDPDPKPYTVREQHPRLYTPGNNLDDLRSRLNASPAVIEGLIKYANGGGTALNQKFDRCLSSMILWWIGLGSDTGLKTKVPTSTVLTVAQYLQRAITGLMDLVTTDVAAAESLNPAGNHYDLNHLIPVAWAYDWLYDVLTEDQRKIARGRIAAALDAALASTAKTLFVSGYNGDAGVGMTLALAIHGETDRDYVAEFHKIWWLEITYWNRQWEQQMEGPGNHEDWGYLDNQVTILAAVFAWFTATGQWVASKWIAETPLLYLHNGRVVPTVDSTGKMGTKYCTLSTCCAGGNTVGRGGAYWLAGATGLPDKQIAAMSAWLSPQVPYAGQPAAGEFFWRCIIGDPRVKPMSPTDAGLPLSYTTGKSGFHWDRASWDPSAPMAFIGCSSQLYRATAVGDFHLSVGGRMLIGNRNQIYDHSYCGQGRLTLPQLMDRNTKKLISARSGDDKRVPGDFASLTLQDGWYVADLSKLFGDRVTEYTRSKRTVWDSPTSGTITIIDECVCRDGFVPVATWGTPLLPAFVTPGQITFTNGIATGLMTFDAPPADIKILGGEGTEAGRDLDNTLYNTNGLANWLKLPRDQQIAAGGFYTVYTFPSLVDGVYRLVTTIRVSL